MPRLWIVHRSPRERAALARLAGATEDSVLASPEDPGLNAAERPEVVLLGVAGDCEPELELAWRLAPRLPGTSWIVVAERPDLARARRLFDALDARFLAYPPERHALREALRDAPRAGAAAPLPLSQRPAREQLVSRFSRWFADLEQPELMRALDPRLFDVPLLICGEPGSGQGALARYLHAFGARPGAELIQVPCSADSDAPRLLRGIAAAGRSPRARRACVLWLDEVDRLPAAVQRQLQGFVSYGLPEGVLQTSDLRWIATAGDREEELEPGLRRALSGVVIRIPPLRERPERIPRLVDDLARAWCGERGQRPRRFGEHALAVLEEYPWPGNLEELEAVVVQSLAASSADPLGAEDLWLEGSRLAPLAEHEARGAELAGPEGESAGAEPAGADREQPARPRLTAVPAAREAAPEAGAGPAVPRRAGAAPPPAETPTAPPAATAGEERVAPPGEAPRPPAPPSPARPSRAVVDATFKRIANALSHEVRTPLTAIRTFAELLPEKHGEREFRSGFAQHVSEGVRKVDRVVDRLERLASLSAPEPRLVDVSGLLEELLDARRSTIHSRHLLVLKELDPGRPHAYCDPEQLRFAFEGLVDKALELLPERGDLYLASRYHPAGLRGDPSVRVLLRLQAPGTTTRAPSPPLSPAENALEFGIVEAVGRAQGGAVAIDSSEPGETLIVIDLPAAVEDLRVPGSADSTPASTQPNG